VILLFYGLPFAAVLIGGPILVAVSYKSGNAWFVTQLLALFGLIAAIIVNQTDQMSGISGSMQAVLLISGTTVGVVLGALVFHLRHRGR